MKTRSRRWTAWVAVTALLAVLWEVAAWLTGTDFTHWVKRQESPSLAASVDDLRRAGVL